MRSARPGAAAPRPGYCACSLALIAAAVGMAPPAPPMRLTRKTLPNGVEVIVAPMPGTRLAAVDVWLLAGSSHEKPEERGAAHFLEHMLFKGTPSRGRGEVDAAVEKCGGLLNAGTLRDAAHVFTTVDRAYVGQVLEVISDAVQHPALERAEFELERTVILDEFASNRRQAGKALYDAAFALAYAGRPEGLPVLGDPTSIARLSREAVEAFHARRYRPGACAVVVAGAVEETATVDAAERAFGAWPRSAPSAVPAQTAEPGSFGPFAVPGNGAEGPRVVRAWRTPPASFVADALIAEIVATLLDQQATDGAGARGGAEAMPGQAGGLLVVWCDPDDRAARARIEATCARLAAGAPSEAEVEACRRRIRATRMYVTETAQGLAREIGTWAMYGNPALPLEVEERLRSITPAQVHEYAKRWLTQGKPEAGP